MNRRSPPSQLAFENFYLPFGGKLSGENRWVKLAELIPWEEFEAQDAEQLSQGMGAPAKSFRNEDILKSSILQLGQHLQPKFGRLILAHPHP